METETKINDGGPAFARTSALSGPTLESIETQAQDGMTLLDYFAAKAMQGIRQNETSMTAVARAVGKPCESLCDAVAELAYAQARSMLKVRDA